MESILMQDKILGDMIVAELDRQISGLEMIASENFTSPAVRAAQGSILTHKYAEGYPGRRYYSGCEFVDGVEELAKERACKLFGAEYANVQPHSGSQANMAAYFAVAQHGDTILGMDLAHGGHLTHGSHVSFSGKLFSIVSYGVDKTTYLIDYDQIADLAQKHKPRIILAGASAYPRFIDFEKLRSIADSVQAYLIVDMAHIAGLVAAGIHPSPVPYADIVTSTTHKTLRGARGGLILAKQEFAKAIDSAVFPMTQGGPLLHVIAAKALCFAEALQPQFVTYQKQVVENAALLARILQDAGLRILTNGTDNHMFLADVTTKNTTGKALAHALDIAGITINKNAIPFDTLPPTVASGIRIGTPALTTRGMKLPEMEKIAHWILRTIEAMDDTAALHAIRKEVHSFAQQFPLFAW